MPIDPVCGMEIKQEDAVASANLGGKIYYFCSQGCKETFEDNPEEFENWKSIAEEEPDQAEII